MRLADRRGLGLAPGVAARKVGHDGLRALFATHDAAYWEEWARKNDLPIVAVRDTSSNSGS